MHLTPRMIVGIISLCITAMGGILGSVFQSMMIDEINRQRQNGNLVSYFFAPLKTVPIIREYHDLYPNGKLRLCWLTATGMAALGILGTAIAVGIFR